VFDEYCVQTGFFFKFITLLNGFSTVRLGGGTYYIIFIFIFTSEFFSIDLHLFLFFSLTSLRLLFRFILITLEFIIFFLTGSTTTSAGISLLLIVAKLADPVLIVVSLFLAEMFYFYSFDNCSFFLTSTTTFADTRIAPFSATNSCQLLLAILNTTYF
jgi:hypothetical protein